MNGGSRTYSTGPQATHTEGSDGRRPQPQTETELVICSVVWQSVPPPTLTLFLHGHNDRLCWAVALPLFSVSLLLLFKFWFATHLSSPPSFFGQIRLSRIPDIPAAYVRNSIQLLWAHKISPFPSLYPSPIPDTSARLHLVCTGRGRTDRRNCCHDHLHLWSCFLFSAFFQKGSLTEPRDSPRRDLEMSFYMYSNGTNRR